MRKTRFSLVLLCTATIVAAGCGGVPIYNVTDELVTPTSQAELTLEQVTRAMLAAGRTTRPAWRMRVVEPGLIRATLHIRSHVATVDIKYTTKSYDITYVESTNLRYNAAQNTIHGSYNSWIQRLDNAIYVELSGL